MTRLLTAGDLAERWSVSTDHVYRLAREGKLPVVELGRYYRFREAAVETFEENGGTASPAPASPSVRSRRTEETPRAREGRQRSEKPLRSAAQSEKSAAGREGGR